MTTRQYIGARYIPVFADPVEWDDTRTYEALMMVQHLGETYMTKQAVPIGVQLPDTSQGEESNEFWVHMSNWNAQVESYRKEVLQYNDRISNVENALPISDFDSENTVTDSLTNLQNQIGSGFDSTNSISATFGSGFDSTNSVSDVIGSSFTASNSVESVIGTGFDATDNIAATLGGSFNATDTVKKYIDDMDYERAVVFDTVSDMKASTILKDGMICHTNGFHVAGDNGAAWYTITDAGTADEMTVITCGDLFANFVQTDYYITPEMLGAYGDGVHDDTAALQAAIDYTNNLCLSGRYVVTDEIEIVRTKSITIFGKNNNRSTSDPTIDGSTITSGAVINIKSDSNGHTGVFMRDFNINAYVNNDKSSGSTAIYIADYTYHCGFENISINDAYYGFNIGRCWNLMFTNVTVRTAREGIRTTGTITSTSFISCVMYECTFGVHLNGGVVYTNFVSCGFDHCYRGILHEGSGSICMLNCGFEDYGIAVWNEKTDDSAIVNIYDAFFYPGSDTTYELQARGRIVCNDITFNTGCHFSGTHLIFNNCRNMTDVNQRVVDGEPLNATRKYEYGEFTIEKGNVQFSPNQTITYTMETGVSYYPYMNLDMTVGCSNELVNVSAYIGTNGTTLYNNTPSNSAVTITKSGNVVTVTFLKYANVFFNNKLRGFTSSL